MKIITRILLFITSGLLFTLIYQGIIGRINV